MRKVAFILTTVLLITKCVSAPIPYDTARIDDSKAFVGVSVQSMDSEDNGEYYNITFITGDLGKSFIKRENFEFGLQGGMGGGRREYRYYVVDKYWYPRDTVVMRIVEHPYEYFGISIFPYFKWAKSSDRNAISLKLSPGFQLGYVRRHEHNVYFPAFPQLLIDLMFGVGNPEVLTFGISFRLDPGYAVVSHFASLHLGDFTFSVLYGYGPQIFSKPTINLPDDVYFPSGRGYISTFHFGVAKKFR